MRTEEFNKKMITALTTGCYVFEPYVCDDCMRKLKEIEKLIALVKLEE